MGELFDRYVVVDWSAAGSPKTGKDSIWIAVADRVGDPALTNPRTRAVAASELAALAGGATLIAVDASLGYPAGAASWFGLIGVPPWRAWWDELAATIVDDDANRNNRFAVADRLNARGGGDGPFWGCPVGAETAHLSPRKPRSFPVPEYRLVEQRLRERGHRPASGWQLLGAGSVGSQSLTLLPLLRRLLGTGPVEVWPFTTGLRAPERGATVVAETWPSAFDLDLSRHPIRDAAQVDGVARRLRRADTAGELSGWFAPPVDAAARRVIEREEGWVLLPPDHPAGRAG